jgi:hypothetical protein
VLREALRVSKYLGRIIPQEYPTPRGCSCGDAGCDNEGKHPAARLVPHGIQHASDDPAVIGDWFKSRPYNIAALALGWWALDADAPKGGPETLDRLVHVHGPLPVTPTQRTGGGGAHYVFAHDARLEKLSTGAWAQGLELKANGRGTITVAPSLHASGTRYRWLPGRAPWEVPIAPAPEWLILRIVERKTPRPVPPPEPSRIDVAYDARLERARKYATRLDPAISGQGGHARTFVVCQKIVRGFDLRPDDALLVLQEWNESCDPPWSRAELQRKVCEASEHGRMARGALLSAGRRAAA